MHTKPKRKGHSNGGGPLGHPPFNKNGEGGRPRKWDEKSLDELAERLDEWIANAIETKKEFFWWDWCFQVGLNQHRVAKYAQQHERFRRSYENAKAWQETIVCRFALTKKFSEGFSKFFLINRNPEHWKDKASMSKEDAKDIIKDLCDAVKDTQSSS